MLSRRQALAGAVLAAPAPPEAGGGGPVAVRAPGRRDFGFSGIYLNAAYVHPSPRSAVLAAKAAADARWLDPTAMDPRHNPRDGAVDRFARLVGAAPADIAVVPSTTTGENLIVQALGLGPGSGVLTDALHYDGSLALYGELARLGVPVSVVKPKVGRIDLADVKAALGPAVRLVAVSLISSDTGFEHDLAELCALAHAQDALVYADIIQAAGAVPLDLRGSGVDFACAGAYKWLMGDFGAAFLYVRPEALGRLKRLQVGWRQVRGQRSHVLPFDPPGPVIEDYRLADGAAGLFEVGTPAWTSLLTTAAGMDYIAACGGPEAIMTARRPLTDRLQERLPAQGLIPLTPTGSRSPVLAFAAKDAARRFGPPLAEAGIKVSLYANRIRIAPSVYNTLEDVDRCVDALGRARA